MNNEIPMPQSVIDRVTRIKAFHHSVSALGETIVLNLMIETGCKFTEIELSTLNEGGFNPVMVAEAKNVTYKIHVDKHKLDFHVTKEVKSLLLEN